MQISLFLSCCNFSMTSFWNWGMVRSSMLVCSRISLVTRSTSAAGKLLISLMRILVRGEVIVWGMSAAGFRLATFSVDPSSVAGWPSPTLVWSPHLYSRVGEVSTSSVLVFFSTSSVFEGEGTTDFDIIGCPGTKTRASEGLGRARLPRRKPLLSFSVSSTFLGLSSWWLFSWIIVKILDFWGRLQLGSVFCGAQYCWTRWSTRLDS